MTTMLENEQPDSLALIEKDLDPSRDYAPEEIEFITGFSIGLVKKMIANGTFYSHDHTGRVRVTGSSVLQYVRYHRDCLELYSRYSERRERQKASKSKARSGAMPAYKPGTLAFTGEQVTIGKRTFRRKSA